LAGALAPCQISVQPILVSLVPIIVETISLRYFFQRFDSSLVSVWDAMPKRPAARIVAFIEIPENLDRPYTPHWGQVNMGGMMLRSFLI
jgi:hypothetical protein